VTHYDEHYVGLTDPEWFNFHKKRHSSNVIFWKPSPKNLRDLEIKSSFYFLVKGKPRFIGGKGKLLEKGTASVESIWRKYSEETGHGSLNDLLNSINSKTSNNAGAITASSEIGWYRLTNVEYFENRITPIETRKTVRGFVDSFGSFDFDSAIVGGKYISNDIGNKIDEKARPRPPSAAILPKRKLQRRPSYYGRENSAKRPSVETKVDVDIRNLVSQIFIKQGYEINQDFKQFSKSDISFKKKDLIILVKILTKENVESRILLSDKEYHAAMEYKHAYMFAFAENVESTDSQSIEIFEYSYIYER